MDAARLGGRQFDEGFDGSARALGGAGLDDFTHEHEKRDHPGDLVIAGSERGEHGNGDQFVDAEPPDPQILDGRDDDGITQDDGADERAGAGDGAALRKQPVHDESVKHKDHTQHGLPQMHDRVLMVMAAAAFRSMLVFVMTQK